MFAHPLMEKVRSIIFNIILHGMKIVDHQMIYRCTPTKMKFCSRCARDRFVKIGPFQICQYESERKPEEINCRCPDDGKRLLIESVVKYQYLSNSMQSEKEELEKELNEYLWKCDQVCHFFRGDRQGT